VILHVKLKSQFHAPGYFVLVRDNEFRPRKKASESALNSKSVMIGMLRDELQGFTNTYTEVGWQRAINQ
jgi:hypothetical protein